MARLSTVERHPDFEKIKAEIRGGAACAVVARAYGLSRQSVDRFKHREAKKLPPAPDNDQDLVLQQVKAMYGQVASLVKTAHEQNNPTKFLSAIKEARGCLRLLADCIGMLSAGNVNVAVGVSANVQVDIVELKQVVLDALRPHPEARQAVATALLVHAEAERGGVPAATVAEVSTTGVPRHRERPQP